MHGIYKKIIIFLKFPLLVVIQSMPTLLTILLIFTVIFKVECCIIFKGEETEVQKLYALRQGPTTSKRLIQDLKVRTI